MKATAALLRGGGELHIVGSEDVVTIEDPHGAVQSLVELVDGARSTSELFSALAPAYPLLRHHDVLDAVSRLEAAGVLEDSTAQRPFL
jgi:hypothetical protein